ncbi:MAG TPA: hypothetical protein VLV30_05830 [Methanomicrobiales archaeon]|nr:hypothetical protein [Methanomicrobiales archaeon]
MPEAVRRGSFPALRSLVTVENIREFIRPSRLDIANRHILLLLFFFSIVSMADVLTTVKFLSLGGNEGNRFVNYLMGIYGMRVLVPFKLTVTGVLAGVVGIFWKGFGVEPRRFFWILILMTFVTVFIVFENIAYIYSLL